MQTVLDQARLDGTPKDRAGVEAAFRAQWGVWSWAVTVGLGRQGPDDDRDLNAVAVVGVAQSRVDAELLAAGLRVLAQSYDEWSATPTPGTPTHSQT